MSKFVILTNRPSAKQQNAITARMKGMGSFWHWMPDAWLFIPYAAGWTAEVVRDQLSAAAPGLHILALEVEIPAGSQAWAIIAPAEWHDWLHKNWSGF